MNIDIYTSEETKKTIEIDNDPLEILISHSPDGNPPKWPILLRLTIFQDYRRC